MNPFRCSDEEHYYKLDNVLLSSCQHLRTVFKARFKSETGEAWTDVEDCAQSFLKGVGRNTFKKARSYEKATLKTKCVEEWDLALICLVLQNVGCSEQYKKNSAVLQLKAIRNFLAHHVTKKIPKEEYDKTTDQIRNSLMDLGMQESVIAGLIEKAGVTSHLQALELLNKLDKKAKHFLNKGDIQVAIKCYSEALEIPSLLPENIADAYRQRAECFLKLAKDSSCSKENCSQAMLDIERAIALNECCWMTHYVAAQCHQWTNDLEKAIHHFQRALAISPVQIQVRNDLDSCKVLAGIQHRQDHLNPRKMPMNLEERIALLQKETGLKLNAEGFNKFNLSHGTFIKGQGQDQVFRGHKYFCGWYVHQNFQEAVKHYEKAAKVKNAEGMYNLAMCYHYGHGVTQNVKEAFHRYLQVAEMNPKTPGEITPLHCNIGVAAAQHSIGLLYDEGIGVEQDHVEAAKWYRRTMENGIGLSANNLAILYSNGKGTAQDMKMAELCWKEAVNLRDHNASASLVQYYLNELEPDNAIYMVRIGREIGNSGLLKLSDTELNKTIARIRSWREAEEAPLVDFEKANYCDTKGLTFRERLGRQNDSIHPSIGRMEKIYERCSRRYVGKGEGWGGKAQLLLTAEMIRAIQQKAYQGSATATGIVETLLYSFQLNWLLESGMNKTAEQKMDIVNSLYNCVIREHHLLRLSETSVKLLQSIVRSLFEEFCDTKGANDMKIRLCYALFNLSGSMQSKDMFCVALLKEGIKRYPDNVHYFDYCVNIFGNKRQFKDGRHLAEAGLKKFPNNVNLLYSLAVLIRLGGAPEKPNPESEEAYKKCLEYAPGDHRKVPEAFYQLSSLSLIYLERVNLEVIDSRVEMERVKSYFHRGKEAERSQLPCYLPYGESDVKCTVENFLALSFSDPKITLTWLASKQAACLKTVLDLKPYLKSPTRKGVVLIHRQNLKETHEAEREINRPGMIKFSNTLTPKLSHRMVRNMSTSTSITLQEMNPTEDHIFHNRILELTILDDLTAFYTSIHLIAEDDNGDVTRLYIYNVNKDRASLDNFRAGCRVGIINPYMRISGNHITNGIRCDDPRCIVYLKKVENMCRFCGEKGDSFRCSLCKRPYCARECQRLDSNELGHELICSLNY